MTYEFNRSFLILGSAHNLREIRIKEKQNVKFMFISSVFKKNKNYLGINKFRIIESFTKKKVIGLGGLSKENLKLLHLTEAKGFAGITFFQTKKKAP